MLADWLALLSHICVSQSASWEMLSAERKKQGIKKVIEIVVDQILCEMHSSMASIYFLAFAFDMSRRNRTKVNFFLDFLLLSHGHRHIRLQGEVVLYSNGTRTFLEYIVYYFVSLSIRFTARYATCPLSMKRSIL